VAIAHGRRNIAIARGCTRDEVRQAFLLKAKHAHSCHGGDDPAFVRFRAAYEQILCELDGRPGLGAQAPERTLRDARIARTSYVELFNSLDAEANLSTLIKPIADHTAITGRSRAIINDA
jgi:hypothetical protein